jgi:hypothetical protein
MTLTYTIRDKDLNLARTVAGGVHLVWAFILVVLWGVAKKDDGERQDLEYPLYTSFASWTDSSKMPAAEITGSECDVPKALSFSATQMLTPGFKDSGWTISLHWLVIFFFLTSALFQTMAVTAVPSKFLLAPTIRFFEYSLTAPLMTVAIALQIGIMSTQTLLLLAVLSWIGGMTALACEKARVVMKAVVLGLKKDEDVVSNEHSAMDRHVTDELKKVVFITQAISWSILVATFIVLLTAFHGSQKACDSPESAPTFVWAIVYGQLLFFCSFGFIQVLEIMRAMSETQADLMYIFIAFCSKTYLGWLIYGGNFVQE